MSLPRAFAALLATAGLALTPAVNEAATLGKTTHGAPSFTAIDVLAFAPDGTLLIGDGRGGQIIAIATNDKGKQSPPAKIADLGKLVSERLGAAAGGVEIVDMAVNPVSQRPYLAVRRQDDKQYAIVTIDSAGALGLFSTASVDFARVALPPGQQAISRITDLAWADDRLLAAAASSEEFGAKIFIARGPLDHEAVGLVHSAETFHVAHNRWETKAPMSAILPYQEDGRTYLVGAFACTPVVKYPVDALEPNAKVKGTSILELGSGNRPLDMLVYTKGGREYVLANSFRFHHARNPFGPSPYWTVRFERELLGETENVNEQALRRLKGTNEQATPRVQMIEAYHGVTQMDLLDNERTVVLREGENGRLDLEVLPLP